MTAKPPVVRFSVTVPGRPAPQGSKKLGAQGQMMEQSAYLRPWRAAVKKAVFERYLALGVPPDSLPYLRGPVRFAATFWLPPERPIDGPPDLDKLLRSTWDALTAARVWEDDGRVVEAGPVSKKTALLGWLGAAIEIETWEVGP